MVSCMMNNKQISRMILRKSNQFLKISIAFFAFSLVLLSTFLTLFLNQYIQVERDFIDNDNTHIIEIYYGNQQNNINELKFSNVEDIKNKINENYKDLKLEVVTEYQLNFGIEDDHENVLFIYGISENGTKFLKDIDFIDDNIYQQSIEGETINLNIPVVSINENGLFSGDVEQYTLKNNKVSFENLPINLYGEQKDKAFVSFETYKKIIEKAYGLNWNDFVDKFNEENTFGIQAIHKLYIYVDSLSHVENVAKTIDSMGYSTNYTFKSFSNFSKSMSNTVFIFTILIIVILLITVIYMILSFNSYLKIQQKDMGILKQYGYTEKSIKKIYSISINKIFAKVFITMTIFTLVIGIYFLGLAQYKYIFLILCISSVLQLVINRIIVLRVLNSYTRKNIIDLLKKSKEFE